MSTHAKRFHELAKLNFDKAESLHLRAERYSGGATDVRDWIKASGRALYEAAVRIELLESAAFDVILFDWSDNDPDAVLAIERLRKLVE